MTTVASSRTRATSLSSMSSLSPDSDEHVRPAKRQKFEAKASLNAEAIVEEELEPKAKKRASKKKGPPPEPKPEDFVQRAANPWKIGPHVSSGGGVENSIVNAAAVGYV